MSTRPPRIGITTYGPEGERGSFSLPQYYVDSVAAAGGVPLLLPASALAPGLVLDVIDALVIAGGGDIDPALYGGDPHETVYSVNPVRDAYELGLMRAALARPALPVLGICRGMQIMNVALGGDLESHLPEVYGDSISHRLPPREPTTHAVTLELGNLVAEILGDGPRELAVCSWHHQSLRKLGAGLRVVARAPDGVPEAIVLEGHPFAFGLQWHPEMQADDPRQRRVFAALIARARS